MSQDPIYRTSGKRTVKMMAILVGICVVGAAIFFSMWDFWISSPAPVVKMRSETLEHEVKTAFTGVHVPVSLHFVESSDFRTFAFNALPGDPDNNPTIHAKVGDEINFDVTNGGKSFHAFGVTAEDEGASGIIPGSTIGTASKPLKPGESGTASFVPGEDGVYYYICTVPGHRAQGMQGKIIVGDVSDEPASSAMPAPEPEMKKTPEMTVKEEPAVTVTPPKVVSPPKEMGPFTGTISIPPGASVPGCDETNECFIPSDVTVSVGTTITWSNDDSAAHTVTSGNPSDGPDDVFDSSIFMAGTTFEHTFDEAGTYDYFCMVHPWMKGKVQVN